MRDPYEVLGLRPGATEEEIKAAYKNGVLELTLPKKEAAPAPAARAIEIE